MEDLPDSKEGLQGMLESLSLDFAKLEEKRKAVLSALSKKEDDEPTAEAEQPTREDVVIVFVEEIEKALQYYEFKDYLRKIDVAEPERDSVATLGYLIKDRKVHEDLRFNKLDFKRIMAAVEGNTSCEVSSEEGNTYYALMSQKKRTLARRVDPIMRLVYHTREKGHVMHKDPLVELGYIKRFDGAFYRRCFVWGLLEKRSERGVMALFVPLHFKEDDMKAALSVCGTVESVKFKSLAPRSTTKVAYVIFENSVEAKLAPVIMDRTSSFYIEPVREKYDYQPKSDAEYNKAMIKYEEFRNYSKRSQIEPISQKVTPSTTRR